MLPVPAFPSAEELLAEGVRTEYPGRPLLGALLVASVRPRSVLDIGGKEGWLFRFLEERARPERMISLDRDARAVARAYPGAARIFKVPV